MIQKALRSDHSAVFAALGDPNRRRVVELLSNGDSTLLELADDFQISFQALGKHIQVLEKAQLLTKSRRGKYRILSLNRDTLRSPMEWMAFHTRLWTESLDELARLIATEGQDEQ